MTRAATVLTVFGTRPEVIKLAPVIHALERSPRSYRTINVSTGQHDSLLYPLVSQLAVRLDHDLSVMTPNQAPEEVLARILTALHRVLQAEGPDLLLVQGDTTSALAGALAGFHRKIPVGHVEAGLRSGDPLNPFPEEMNRRLISRLATYHFAATELNRATLIAEGVPATAVFVTGNPGIDALKGILSSARASASLARLLEETHNYKRLVLTTHRRESFGAAMADSLRLLRQFVEAHPDTALLFPVHPNPSVRECAERILRGHPRVWLLEPLTREDFVLLMAAAWLLISDSGGVQEEVATLGKPLIVLRENTERPEAVEVGVARLTEGRPERLRYLLDEACRDETWTRQAAQARNPFGQGDGGERIAAVVGHFLGARLPTSDLP